MDMLGVNRYSSIMKTKQKQMTNDKRRSRSISKDVKVVYISSPMKVKASASEFRALVQELTGRHSDTARLMEMSTSSTVTKSDDEDSNNDYHDHQLKVVDDHANHDLSFSGGFYDLPSSSTTSKPSLFQPFDHDQRFDFGDYVFSSYDYVLL